MDVASQVRVNAPSVVHETIDGEVIIISIASGAYYSLAGTGAAIWNCMVEGTTLPDLTREIGQQYHGETREIESAVSEFVTGLRHEELIVEIDEDRGPSVLAGDAERRPLLLEKTAFEKPVLHKYTDMQEFILLDPIYEIEKDGWPSVGTSPSA